MTRDAVIVALVGSAIAAVGFLGWRGNLQRGPSNRRMTNFTATLAFGLGLMLCGISVLLPQPLETVLAVPSFAVVLFGVWCALVRPPKWARPGWQRDQEAQTMHRRTRP